MGELLFLIFSAFLVWLFLFLLNFIDLNCSQTLQLHFLNFNYSDILIFREQIILLKNNAFFLWRRGARRSLFSLRLIFLPEQGNRGLFLHNPRDRRDDHTGAEGPRGCWESLFLSRTIHSQYSTDPEAWAKSLVFSYSVQRFFFFFFKSI